MATQKSMKLKEDAHRKMLEESILQILDKLNKISDALGIDEELGEAKPKPKPKPKGVRNVAKTKRNPGHNR